MIKHGTARPQAGAGIGTAALLALALVGLLSKRTVGPSGRPVDGPASATPPNLKSGADPLQTATCPPAAAHPPGVIGLGRAVIERVGRDNITLVAAGIAFYVMLGIFPALGALVSLYGLVGNPADVATRVSDYNGLLPPEAMKLITDGLNSFAKTSSSQLSLALLTSVVLALWSARAGISSVMTGLNIAYEETERRSFVVQTLVALALTVAGVLFAVVAILAIAVVPILLKFFYLDSVTSMLLDLARWPLLAVMVVLGFAVIYRWAPSRSHPRWTWISWGSAVATLLWLIGSFVFSFYVSKFGSYDATYGSLGAVVVLLLWLWVSALIMLLGAEIDSELDVRNTGGGSPLAGVSPRSGPPRAAGAAQGG